MAVKSNIPPSSYWRSLQEAQMDQAARRWGGRQRFSLHRKVWQRGCTEGSENTSNSDFLYQTITSPQAVSQKQPCGLVHSLIEPKVVFWAVISLLCILQNVIYACNMQLWTFTKTQHIMRNLCRATKSNPWQKEIHSHNRFAGAHKQGGQWSCYIRSV